MPQFNFLIQPGKQKNLAVENFAARILSKVSTQIDSSCPALPADNTTNKPGTHTQTQPHSRREMASSDKQTEGKLSFW